MEQVMCRSCGEFIEAKRRAEGLTPMVDECPDCGGVEFKHHGTETVLRTDR